MSSFPEEGYITITVAKGLIDLSESFEPQQDNFTSVYQVPEEVIEYLETGGMADKATAAYKNIEDAGVGIEEKFVDTFLESANEEKNED